jgi:hypothetical protein
MSGPRNPVSMLPLAFAGMEPSRDRGRGMVTERQVQETIARCVSTMVYYHNGERSRELDERMTAEIQMVAGFVRELDFSRDGVESRIIRPVEVELVARYGHEVGPRLASRFFEAFEGLEGLEIERG